MLHLTRFIAVALLGVGVLAGADTFLDGTHLVGKGIQPGIYAAPGGARCTWSIFRSGDSNVTGGGKGPAIELAASDLAFHSSGCGMWRPAPETVLAQVEDRMWIDAANMFIAALTVALRDTADNTLRDTIYQRTLDNVENLMANPTTPTSRRRSWTATWHAWQAQKIRLPAKPAFQDDTLPPRPPRRSRLTVSAIVLPCRLRWFPWRRLG